MCGNVNWIFPTDTLQQKIEITDLKPFLADENTSVLMILATTVYNQLTTSELISLYLKVYQLLLKKLFSYGENEWSFYLSFTSKSNIFQIQTPL